MAYDLSIIRIIVFFVLTYIVLNKENAPYPYLHLPRELQVRFPGDFLIQELIQFPRWVIEGLRDILILCSVCALAGLFASWTSLISAVLAYLILGIPHITGKMNHYHHIIWFSWIMALSPSGRVLSVDSLLKKNRQENISCVNSNVYGLPIRFIWVLIGMIYFFPGFWKLWTCGSGWIFSDNLKMIMYNHWQKFGDFVPPFRLDFYPVLYKFAASIVIGYELVLIFLVFFPQVRRFLPLFALLFHGMNAIFVRILFGSLLAMHLSFLEYSRFFRKFRSMNILVRENPIRRRALIFFFALAVSGNIFYGVKKQNAWPFSPYPTFDWYQANEKKWLRIVGVDDEGRNYSIEGREIRAQISTSRWTDIVERVASIKDLNRQTALAKKLGEYLLLFDPAPENVSTIRVYQQTLDIRPEKKYLNPISENLIVEFPLIRGMRNLPGKDEFAKR